MVGDSGGVDFSSNFLRQLCLDAYDWQKGKYKNWVDFILSAISNSLLDEKTQQIPLFEEEIAVLFSDATIQVYKFLLEIAVNAKILYVNERIGVHEEFNEEIYEAADSQQGHEQPREFIIRMFVEISRAKLLLLKHVHSDLFRVVGMLAFSMWSGKGHFDDLEGLTGDERTEMTGVTHPGGTASLKEIGHI